MRYVRITDGVRSVPLLDTDTWVGAFRLYGDPFDVYQRLFGGCYALYRTDGALIPMDITAEQYAEMCSQADATFETQAETLPMDLPEPPEPPGPHCECGASLDDYAQHGQRSCCSDCCTDCWLCSECDEWFTDTEDPCACSHRRINGRRIGTVCTDCCTSSCFWCDGCQEHHNGYDYNVCDNCDSCTEHHECMYCDSCNEYVSANDHCGSCDRCDSHCECASAGIRLVQNRTKFWDGLACKANPSKRHISAEIEIASTDDDCSDANDYVNNWRMSVVTDGSVSGGVEINTAPASGDAWLRQIAEITDALDTAGAKVDDRCGLHVHIDARDYRYIDAAKLLWLYHHIEDTVFSLVNSRRRESRWCLKRASQIDRWLGGESGIIASGQWSPAQWKERVLAVAAELYAVPAPAGVPPEFDPERPPTICHCSPGCEAASRELLETWHATKARLAQKKTARPRTKQLLGCFPKARLNQTRPTRKKTPGWNRVGGDRYFALNLQAWFKHGTMEVRLHGGTTDRDKIANWGILWARLLDVAKRASVDDVLRMVQQDPWSLLLSIMPTDEMRKFYTARRIKFGWVEATAENTIAETTPARRVSYMTATEMAYFNPGRNIPAGTVILVDSAAAPRPPGSFTVTLNGSNLRNLIIGTNR